MGDRNDGPAVPRGVSDPASGGTPTAVPDLTSASASGEASASASGAVPVPASDIAAATVLGRTLVDGLERVIRGKRPLLEHLVTGILAGGHCLIEDVPGLGKTTLAKTAARLIDGAFHRIQFTPDLLPYDITGVDVFDPKTGGFVFTPGPVFANVILADEINRTTPKVQSALLEVMAEHQVTVGRRTYPMDPLFFVVATQNPVETEGVWHLPLAQVDRFLMKLRVGYPDLETEVSIVRDDPSERVMPEIRPVCGRAEVLAARAAVDRVFCDDRLLRAAVGACAATRGHQGVELGASPRGSLMLVRAARALALVRGRDYVIDQDLVELAPLVVAHRLRLKDARADAGELAREIVLGELARIPY